MCVFLKSLLTAVTFSASGYAVGYLVAKKKFEKELDFWKSEYEYLEEKTKIKEFVEGMSDDFELEVMKEHGTSREEGMMSSEERKEIKEKLREMREQKTNYAAMYQNDEDEEEEPEEEDDENSPEMIMNHWHDENKEREPELVSDAAVQALPRGVEQEALYYHTADGIVCDENGEVVENPRILLGDVLDECGFAHGDTDEEMIWVLNYQTDTAYLVQKIEGSFD